MNAFVRSVAAALFPNGYENLSSLNLKALCDQYPFAPALQLLYAQRLKEENSSDYNDQWQKTLLYFPHPLLLQYLVADLPAFNDSNTVKTFTDIDSNPIPSLKIEPLDESKADLLFMPYHTVDYFASQGIQLQQQTAKPDDQFGRQLKSFTEWLKEMRRLPGTSIQLPADKNTEKVVEKLAEKSLDGQNEDTAAMAEVWAKQGHPEKAITIYQKLSLQNPAKRAYFAAKIEHLKKSL